MSNPGLPQKLQIRIICSCLDKVRALEEDPNEKKMLEKVVEKLGRSEERRELLALSQPHSEMLKSFLEVFHSLRRGFEDVSRLEEFSGSIRSDFNIINYLVEVQPAVPIVKEKTDRDSVFTKYYVFLTSNFKKVFPAIGNKFAERWVKKAKERAKQEPEKSKPPSVPEETVSKTEEKKKQPTIPVTQPTREKAAERRFSDSAEDSEASPQPPKRNEQDKARERERELQREREERENEKKQRIMREHDELSREEERRRKEENQRRADTRELLKISRGKAAVIEKYIQSRKMGFEKGKNKEVCEHLASKLDHFLKHTVQKLYNIACLKNKKNPKFGNELGYYAEQYGRVGNYSEFYFHPNSKIYTLSYKHKHEIYANLRIKEVKKEDQLRNGLQARTNEGEKKIDKRIESYMLKQRPKETDANLGPFRDERENYRQLNSLSVVISLEHMVYYLENHPWLKNSLLLFNVYHRF